MDKLIPLIPDKVVRTKTAARFARLILIPRILSKPNSAALLDILLDAEAGGGAGFAGRAVSALMGIRAYDTIHLLENMLACLQGATRLDWKLSMH